MQKKIKLFFFEFPHPVWNFGLNLKIILELDNATRVAFFSNQTLVVYLQYHPNYLLDDEQITFFLVELSNNLLLPPRYLQKMEDPGSNPIRVLFIFHLSYWVNL